MAIISHALTLIHDINGVIVLQWFLDSGLPGRYKFIAPVLRGHLAELCLSKHASSVVAKLIHPAVDLSCREQVYEELFDKKTLSMLLLEPLSAAIILRCLTTTSPEQKIKLAHITQSQIEMLSTAEYSHLQKIADEVNQALAMVTLETERRSAFEDPLQRIKSSTSTLLNHAVGGPVFGGTTKIRTNNAPNERPNGIIGNLTRNEFPTINGASENGTIRSLSFGSVATFVNSGPTNKISSTNKTGPRERLSFGPSLLNKLDIGSNASESSPS